MGDSACEEGMPEAGIVVTRKEDAVSCGHNFELTGDFGLVSSGDDESTPASSGEDTVLLLESPTWANQLRCSRSGHAGQRQDKVLSQLRD